MDSFSSGDNWYMDQPQAMNKLIEIGLENMNMFQNPIFLHNHSLLNLEGTMLSGFKVGQNLGELGKDQKKNWIEFPSRSIS